MTDFNTRGRTGRKTSMLDLTGEEQTITITENTVITKNEHGKTGRKY
ncbi:MAG: hypothetical protein IJF03_12435 [Lachnospiraceae bacterium]|nr:hypothetical protein [Lachnospiraceae bacterium]